MQYVESLPCKCRCWRRRKRQPRLIKKRMSKSWTACRPRDDEAKTEFNRAVLQTKEGESQDCLEQDQKMIEEAVEEIPTVRKWNQGQGCQTTSEEDRSLGRSGSQKLQSS